MAAANDVNAVKATKHTDETHATRPRSTAELLADPWYQQYCQRAVTQPAAAQPPGVAKMPYGNGVMEQIFDNPKYDNRVAERINNYDAAQLRLAELGAFKIAPKGAAQPLRYADQDLKHHDTSLVKSACTAGHQVCGKACIKRKGTWTRVPRAPAEPPKPLVAPLD